MTRRNSVLILAFAAKSAITQRKSGLPRGSNRFTMLAEAIGRRARQRQVGDIDARDEE